MMNARTESIADFERQIAENRRVVAIYEPSGSRSMFSGADDGPARQEEARQRIEELLTAISELRAGEHLG